MDSGIYGLVNSIFYARKFNHALRFKKRVGFWPNVARPRTMNERILWRKTFDFNPIFITFSDKIATKSYFNERCPELSVAPTLWVGDRSSEIPEELWNARVAIKINASSGQNIFLRGEALDRDKTKQSIDAWMSGEPFGKRYGEWSYARVERKILIEPLHASTSENPLMSVKAHCCDGVVLNVKSSRVHVLPDGRSIVQQGVFSRSGERMPGRSKGFKSDELQLPDSFAVAESFHEAVEFAEELSLGLDFVRVDFMCTKDEVHGGEITIFPGAGYDIWKPALVSDQIEVAWDLRKSWFMQSPQDGILKKYAEALWRDLDHRCGPLRWTAPAGVA